MKVTFEFETNNELYLLETILLSGLSEELVSITYTCKCGDTTKTVREDNSLSSIGQADKDERFLEQHAKCYEQHDKTISNFN